MALSKEELRQRHRESALRSYYRDPEGNRAKRKIYRDANKERLNEGQRRRNAALRKMIIREYGGVCVCCSESEIKFLAIDHINNDGGIQRKTLGVGVGATFYWWLKKRGFPKEGLQILCHNCNIAKGFYGACPHAA